MSEEEGVGPTDSDNSIGSLRVAESQPSPDARRFEAISLLLIKNLPGHRLNIKLILL